MRGIKVVLGIGIVLSAAALAGMLVTGMGWSAATPAASLAVTGALLYKVIRNPSAELPRPTRRQFTLQLVLLGIGSAVTAGCLAWVFAINPALEVRLVTAFGILLVLTTSAWFVHTVRPARTEQ